MTQKCHIQPTRVSQTETGARKGEWGEGGFRGEGVKGSGWGMGEGWWTHVFDLSSDRAQGVRLHSHKVGHTAGYPKTRNDQ